MRSFYQWFILSRIMIFSRENDLIKQWCPSVSCSIKAIFVILWLRQTFYGYPTLITCDAVIYKNNYWDDNKHKNHLMVYTEVLPTWTIGVVLVVIFPIPWVLVSLIVWVLLSVGAIRFTVLKRNNRSNRVRINVCFDRTTNGMQSGKQYERELT